VQLVVGLIIAALGLVLLVDLGQVRTRALRAVTHARKGLSGGTLGMGTEADVRSQRALLLAFSAFLLAVGVLLVWASLTG